MIDIKDISHAPSLGEIGVYIGLLLFDTFCQYMDTEYEAIRKIEYSKDVWARGWNVKFKKAGKTTSEHKKILIYWKTSKQALFGLGCSLFN